MSACPADTHPLRSRFVPWSLGGAECSFGKYAVMPDQCMRLSRAVVSPVVRLVIVQAIEP